LIQFGVRLNTIHPHDADVTQQRDTASAGHLRRKEVEVLQLQGSGRVARLLIFQEREGVSPVVQEPTRDELQSREIWREKGTKAMCARVWWPFANPLRK
jgi:hypothetical protein